MNNPVKKFMLAIDLDPANQTTIHYAVELANLSEGHLYICHADSDNKNIYGQDLFHPVSADDNDVHESSLQRLAAIYPNAYPWDIRLNCQITYATFMAFQIAGGILDLAEKIEPDLLILRKENSPVFYKKYFGEISKTVISKAGSMVLLVPEHLKSPTCKTLSYARSLEAKSDQILINLHRFTDLFGAVVNRFHISTSMQDDTRIPVLTNNKEDLLQGDYVLTGKTVIEGIHHFLKTRKPDILAFSLLQKEIHKTFDSLAFRTLIADIRIPVLFVVE